MNCSLIRSCLKGHTLMLMLLEHNLFKNASKESFFLWTQIQTIAYAYGLNECDTDKKEASYIIDTLLIYTLWYQFQTIWISTSDFGKNFATKNLLHCIILFLKACFNSVRSSFMFQRTKRKDNLNIKLRTKVSLIKNLPAS